MRVECKALTHPGLIREVNQDSMLSCTKHGLFLVADGMGGEAAGDEASARTVQSVEEAFGKIFEKNPEKPEEIEILLRDSLMQANRDVFQIGIDSPEKKGLGSTASLLSLYRGIYTVAQVGDSRVYLFRTGVLRQLTRDHTMVWNLYEQGVITRDQLETHSERHLLTQCIGSEHPLLVDTFGGLLEKGDLFMICSDGLTGDMLEKDILKILSGDEIPLLKKAEMLIQMALDGGGRDNISVVLIRVIDLGEEDNWTPLDSMQTGAMERGGHMDTLGHDTSPNHQFRAPEHRPRAGVSRQLRTVFVCSLLILLVVGLLPGLLQSDPVKVYLTSADYIQDGGVIPTQIHVVVRQNDREIMQFDLEPSLGDETYSRPFFDLPGPGDYQVRVVAEGFLDVFEEIQVEEQDVTVSLNIAWAHRAHLIVELPMDRRIRELKVVADYGAYDQIVYRGGGKELGKLRQLDIYIEGGILHAIQAESEDGSRFHRKFRLAAGERCTFKLF